MLHTPFFLTFKNFIVARNKNKTYKTLLSVLANGSTDQARGLLTKHSGENAKDLKDLEVKLARVYALSTNKKDIEREFAEIHPHKDFILKYIKPTAPTTTEEVVQGKQEEINTVPQEPKKNVMLHDGYANANGSEQCPCYSCMQTSNATGTQSAPCTCDKCTGNQKASSETPHNLMQNNQSIMVLGIISVVAILGMVLYINKNKQ
jgi:hypothetical protein